MSNDIRYLDQDCDHLKVDDLLLNFVTQQELTPTDYYFIRAKFGQTRYGTVKYGIGTRYKRSLQYAEGGTYTVESNGSVTATASLDYPCTLNYFRLFKRGSTDDDRVEIPEIEYESSTSGTPTAIADSRYGAGHTYSTDNFGRTLSLVEGSTEVRNYRTNWRLVDNQTIRIFNYSPDNEYYADYVTTQFNCPKCGDNGTLNDLVFDNLARISLVHGLEKVVQEILLSLLREIKSNPFFPNYGTDISGLIGQNKALFDLEDKVKEQVITQISNLRRRQAQRMNMDPDFLSPAEILHDVTMIDVDLIDPDKLKVTVAIITLQGEETFIKAEVS